MQTILFIGKDVLPQRHQSYKIINIWLILSLWSIQRINECSVKVDCKYVSLSFSIDPPIIPLILKSLSFFMLNERGGGISAWMFLFLVWQIEKSHSLFLF